MSGRTYNAKDLQSIWQLGVKTFFDSLGVLHLPLLGRAAWRGKANISLNISVVDDDPDVQACLESFLHQLGTGVFNVASLFRNAITSQLVESISQLVPN